MSNGELKHLTVYRQGKRCNISLYVPTMGLGNTIKNGIDHCLGKLGTISNINDAESQKIAIVRAIKDSSELMSTIRQAGNQIGAAPVPAGNRSDLRLSLSSSTSFSLYAHKLDIDDGGDRSGKCQICILDARQPEMLGNLKMIHDRINSFVC